MADIWEKVTLATGDLTLTCLPGIGGRLWDVTHKGRSILFQNPDLTGVTPDLGALQDLPTRSPQFRFPLWGGEKTWIAPDRDWIDQSPYPILDSGPYNLISSDARSVHMQSQVCDTSGLQIDREIRLLSPEGWTIRHRVKNCGTSSRETGIWSVLMLKHAGRIGLRPETDSAIPTVFGDATGRVRRLDDAVVFGCTAPQEFKCGASNASGLVVIGLGDDADPTMLTCRSAPSGAETRFAHGHGFEVFNSGDYPYFEAEWHSPVSILEPGASASFEQHFAIRRDLSTETTAAPPSSLEQEIARCMY